MMDNMLFLLYNHHENNNMNYNDFNNHHHNNKMFDNCADDTDNNDNDDDDDEEENNDEKEWKIRQNNYYICDNKNYMNEIKSKTIIMIQQQPKQQQQQQQQTSLSKLSSSFKSTSFKSTSTSTSSSTIRCLTAANKIQNNNNHDSRRILRIFPHANHHHQSSLKSSPLTIKSSFLIMNFKYLKIFLWLLMMMIIIICLIMNDFCMINIVESIAVNQSLSSSLSLISSPLLPLSPQALSMKKYSTKNGDLINDNPNNNQNNHPNKQSSSSSMIIDKYFSIKPTDVYVIEGDNTELKCQINSNIDNYGPVQWSKDGFLLGFEAIIPGHNNRYTMFVNQTTRTYNLQINNVQLEDEAEYECQTTGTSALSTMSTSSAASSSSSNTVLSSSNNHHHQQQQQPTTNKQPIRAAANLHLIIPPKVIYINSTRSYDPNPNVSSTTTTLSSIHHYNHRMNPTNNKDDYKQLLLNHIQQQQQSTLLPNSTSIFMIDAYEGEKIILICYVPYSKPPPRLKWYRKNIELLPEASKTTITKTLLSNRHTIYSIESNLILYPKTDEEYRCQAEHKGLSKPLRAIAMINIYRQPSLPMIDGYKNGDIINYNDKLTLKCISLNGYPPPTIIWYRNGVEIDHTSTISLQNNGRYEVINQLTIIVDQNDNQAQYTCQVMNSLTTVPLQETITLNVFLFPTKIHIDGPTEVLLLEHNGSIQATSITLECNAYPISKHQTNDTRIRWLIDGHEEIDDQYYSIYYDHHSSNNNNNNNNNNNGQTTSSMMTIINNNNDSDDNNINNNNDNNNYNHIIKQQHEHDQQSWTLRSNLTIVINRKEPNVRNIACIAYSIDGKFETLSSTHQINVIYPPEMPILLGIENGKATVFADEIFKCKCVCYGGNPRGTIIWLNQYDHEISALATTTTGTNSVSSELVIRPNKNDHGQMFRCHVQHPSISMSMSMSMPMMMIMIKPMEVFFTLHVIYPPDQLNITIMPKFIKENDTVKIECTTNESNPCPRLTMIMSSPDDNSDGHGHNSDDNRLILSNDHDDTGHQGHYVNTRTGKRIQIRTLNNDDQVLFNDNHRMDWPMADDINGILYRTECRSNQSMLNPMKTNRIVYIFRIRSDDDHMKFSCIANNPMIKNHALRSDKVLAVHYKPKFPKRFDEIELNEFENYEWLLRYRSNSIINSIKLWKMRQDFSSNHSLIDWNHIRNHFEPDHNLKWSHTVDNNTIRINFNNVSINDSGLYVLQASNSIDSSFMFIRLVVHSVMAINNIQLLISKQLKMLNDQPESIVANDGKNVEIFDLKMITNEDNHSSIMDNGQYFIELICDVNATDFVDDYDRINRNRPSIYWTKQFLSRYSSKTFDYSADQPSEIGDSNENNFDWLRTNISESYDKSSGRIYSKLFVNRLESIHDSGVYTCNIEPNQYSNSHQNQVQQTIKNQSIIIRIAHRPLIINNLYNDNNNNRIAADPNEYSIKFICNALSFTENIEFEWTHITKDGHHHRRIPITNNGDKYRQINSNSKLSSLSLKTIDMIKKSYHQHNELIIYNLNDADYGQYQCSVRNDLGNATAMFELVHKDKPECPKSIRILNQTNRRILLHWIAGFDYGHEQTFTIRLWPYDGHNDNVDNYGDDGVDYDLNNGDNVKIYANISNNYFEFDNLESSKQYRLLLWSRNRLGRCSRPLKYQFNTLSTMKYRQQQQHQQQQTYQKSIKPLYSSLDDDNGGNFDGGNNGRNIEINDDDNLNILMNNNNNEGGNHRNNRNYMNGNSFNGNGFNDDADAHNNGIIDDRAGSKTLMSSKTTTNAIGDHHHHHSINHRHHFSMNHLFNEDFFEFTIFVFIVFVIIVLITISLIIFTIVYLRKRKQFNGSNGHNGGSNNCNNDRQSNHLNDDDDDTKPSNDINDDGKTMMPESPMNDVPNINDNASTIVYDDSTFVLDDPQHRGFHDFQPIPEHQQSILADSTAYHIIEAATGTNETNDIDDDSKLITRNNHHRPPSSTIIMNDHYINIVDYASSAAMASVAASTTATTTTTAQPSFLTIASSDGSLSPSYSTSFNMPQHQHQFIHEYPYHELTSTTTAAAATIGESNYDPSKLQTLTSDYGGQLQQYLLSHQQIHSTNLHLLSPTTMNNDDHNDNVNNGGNNQFEQLTLSNDDDRNNHRNNRLHQESSSSLMIIAPSKQQLNGQKLITTFNDAAVDADAGDDDDQHSLRSPPPQPPPSSLSYVSLSRNNKSSSNSSNHDQYLQQQQPKVSFVDNQNIDCQQSIESYQSSSSSTGCDSRRSSNQIINSNNQKSILKRVKIVQN